MLTARGEPMDRVVGLEIGADDYLAKPFEPRELQARLRAILRRKSSPQKTEILRFGRLEIDKDARTVRVDGEERSLTSYQFALLLALAERAGRVLSRDALMDVLKGEKLEAFDRSVDVHVSRIRAAIEDDPKKPRRILTVRGTGYVFARDQDRVALTRASTCNSTPPSCWCWRCSWRCGPADLAARRGADAAISSTSRPSSPAPCCPTPMRRRRKTRRRSMPCTASCASISPSIAPTAACSPWLAARRRASIPIARASAGGAAIPARASPCSCPTAAGWWRARCANGRARPCGSRASSCCWRRRSPSAPIRWCAGSAAASSGSRPASSSWAAAISARACRSRAATSWRRWPQASTARPRASRSWWRRIACCWPTAATSCARRWRASAWRRRCWARPPTPRRASR